MLGIRRYVLAMMFTLSHLWGRLRSWRGFYGVFGAAGGLRSLIRELIDAGLMHHDVKTAMDQGLGHFATELYLDAGTLESRMAPAQSGNTDIARRRKPLFGDGLDPHQRKGSHPA